MESRGSASRKVFPGEEVLVRSGLCCPPSLGGKCNMRLGEPFVNNYSDVYFARKRRTMQPFGSGRYKEQSRVQRTLRKTFGGGLNRASFHWFAFHVTKTNKLTAEELAQAFAIEYREILSWRVRTPHSGEPYCWFVHGRLDEYGISVRELGRLFLKNGAFRQPQRFGLDCSDERVYEILERAKKILTIR